MSVSLVKPSLAELRLLIGATSQTPRPRQPFSLYPAGFFLGSFVELSGSQRTEFAALFLKENPQLSVAWIEETISINPYALKQKGVCVESILFIEGKKDILWSLNQVLSSGCFQVVVAENSGFNEKDFRRFQLLSEKTLNHFFLLSPSPSTSWVPHLQLHVRKSDTQWDIETRRMRGLG
ncbi:MAG: hypothetical protein JNL11_05815 [Bdellovibrionaceae bacterium]|nr:hypothetical protein [Pseudobdellovibrionaceae bacterium]